MAKKMPIDIKKLFESVSVIGQQRDLPVCVHIIYDATAPDELIDSILRAFSTANPAVSIVETVLGGAVPNISVSADLCVVVAGDSVLVGDVAGRARSFGVPTVVVALDGKGEAPASATLVGEGMQEADEQGALVMGIPEADYIRIDHEDPTKRPLEELGVWVIRNVVEKRLALSSNFEFLRHPMAGELAISNAIQNGAIGTVFFMPGADMPLITLNQAKMVLEIAAVYGQPLTAERAKELIAVVAGAYGLRGIARQLARQVPGPLGIPIKAGIAFTGTMAMGYAAIDYFEEGGVVSTVVENAQVLYKAADKYARAGLDVANSVAQRLRIVLNGTGRKAPGETA